MRNIRPRGTRLKLSIRARTILYTSSFVVALAITLTAIIWSSGQRAISRFEHEETDRALVSAQAVIDYQFEHLMSLARDWATWDDTYEYVSGRNPQFATEDLTHDTLLTLDLDFMVVFDRNGKALLSIHRSAAAPGGALLDPSSTDVLASSPALSATYRAGRPAFGFVTVNGELLAVAAARITDSSASAPTAGSLVVGQRMNSTRNQVLGRLANMPVAVYATTDTNAPGDVLEIAAHAVESAKHTIAWSPNWVTGYLTMNDADGQPTVILRTSQQRFVHAAAARLLRDLVVLVATFSVTAIVLLGLLVDRLVLGRLAKMSRDVRQIGLTRDPRHRFEITGHDEISDVKRNLNAMLDELEGSHTELAYLASHDSLTGLVNRRRFESELGDELAAGRRGAVLWFDLDHFKEINDTLGHAAGDDLLEGFAQLLRERTRGGSLIARLGGDEFGIMISRAGETEAIGAAQRLLEVLSTTTFAVAGHEVRVSASVGVVLYPDHGETCDELLARADLAMYRSKGQGRNSASVYAPSLGIDEEMSDKMALSGQIARSIASESMVFHAQPIMNIETGDVVAYELLLRMKADDGTTLAAQDVIVAAERLGLIRDLDRWAIRQSCGVLAQEQAAGRDTCIHVNLSGSAFSDPDLLDYLRSELTATGVDPAKLTIEITETSVITDIAFASKFIESLQAAGCRFALDDFGAGASSLYYLKHLPVDCLKIDGSLIAGLDANSRDIHFVRAIVEMCKGLGVTTIAEHLGDQGVYCLLSEFGVDCGQGYLLGPPAPLADYLADRPEGPGAAVCEGDALDSSRS